MGRLHGVQAESNKPSCSHRPFKVYSGSSRGPVLRLHTPNAIGDPGSTLVRDLDPTVYTTKTWPRQTNI